MSIDSKIEENEIQDQSQSNEDEIINEDDHYEDDDDDDCDYHDNDEKNYSYSEEENGIRGDFISDEDEIINEDEPDKCIADIGGASGEEADCEFPYIYQGKEYHKCITKDHDTHWCALDMPHFVVNGGLNLFCVKCWQNETYRWGNCKSGKSCGLGQPQSNEDEIINEDDHYEGNFELTYDNHEQSDCKLPSRCFLNKFSNILELNCSKPFIKPEITPAPSFTIPGARS